MTDVLKQEFSGDVYQFTDEGWFNATQAAKRFGKEPNEWVNQIETLEYIQALNEHLGNPRPRQEFTEIKDLPSSSRRAKAIKLAKETGLVSSKGGAPENGGGTWWWHMVAPQASRSIRPMA